jgi:hypothetical protein
VRGESEGERKGECGCIRKGEKQSERVCHNCINFSALFQLNHSDDAVLAGHPDNDVGNYANGYNACKEVRCKEECIDDGVAVSFKHQIADMFKTPCDTELRVK